MPSVCVSVSGCRDVCLCVSISSSLLCLPLSLVPSLALFLFPSQAQLSDVIRPLVLTTHPVQISTAKISAHIAAATKAAEGGRGIVPLAIVLGRSAHTTVAMAQALLSRQPVVRQVLAALSAGDALHA